MINIFSLTILIALIIGFLSLLAIYFQKDDLHAFILTDIVESAMLIILAAISTDLAEALILPGLVVSLAELLAVSQVLLTRNSISKNNKKVDIFEEFRLPLQDKILKYDVEMEILETAPKFFAIILVIYGAILSGFTGGAVMASGLLFYAITQKAIGKELMNMWKGVTGLSGVAWALWIFGFLGFYIFPKYWLAFLLMAGLGLVIKVGYKLGLIGYVRGELDD
ncbi:hypothetical protein J422_00566 [Methanocaldococcus villosus KIN24-T80]|uniref:Uncharacterized protein n=1 Tax=Methanocaldococcus villosus KIN24-T80 TaxID=1069083 RepID=N6UWP5_9EURY|nr:EhaG family protein [Methanocaldococcus villosus]ENN96764.1 hypothetical protein J422_00566 [Methanocaldococcus villosus KIN24-T80]